MEKKFRTSVVVATYNGEKYIIDQLKSIMCQSLIPDEVIISDDGSKDATIELVEHFIETNSLKTWKVIHNLVTKGISDNFYRGLSQVTGDIVFLCDQDDIWKANKIERIIEEFEEDSECECVISAIDYIDENGRKINSKTVYTNSKNHVVTIKELLCVCSYLGMSCAVKREVISNTQIELLNNTSHDWAIILSAYNMGKVKYIGERLQKYRLHDDNNSVIRNKSINKKRRMLIERQKKHIEYSYDCVEEEDLIKKYSMFLAERIRYIERHACWTILLNIFEYISLGYSLRNVFADVYAAIRR